MAANDGTRGTSLYVGDLHPKVTEKDLTDTFAQVGPLLSVHLCRDKFSGKSLCYAYVNFWLPCHAFTALQSLNHTVLRGKSLRIMWYERDPAARKNGIGNLFVKNLDQSITSARLQTIFSKYGTILSCKVVEKKGVSKGIGFVQFDSEDSAMAALNALHDTEVDGKKLYVSKFRRNFDGDGAANEAKEILNGELIRSKNLTVGRALKSAGRNYADQFMESKASNLFVKNLDLSVDDKKLEELFSTYGKVISANIIRTGGVSRGFGFVSYSSPADAKKALSSLNGADFEGMTLYVAVAWPKKEQTSELYKSYEKIPPQQPPCNFPHLISTLSSSGSSYLSLAQNLRVRGNFYALPMQLTALKVCGQGRSLEMPKDQKSPSRLQLKLRNDDGNQMCNWWGTVKTHIAGSSPEIGKLRPGYVHYPPVQKLQFCDYVSKCKGAFYALPRRKGFVQERHVEMWKGKKSCKFQQITDGLCKGSGAMKALCTGLSLETGKTTPDRVLPSSSASSVL